MLAPSIIRALTDLMMEAESTSETSENVYQTTRRYNPEDSRLHTRRRENLILLKKNTSYKSINCEFNMATLTHFPTGEW
jgi:DNA polymerase III delta prime subunit